MSTLSIIITPEKRTQRGCKNCGIMDRELFKIVIKGVRVKTVRNFCAICSKHRVFRSGCWYSVDTKVPVRRDETLQEAI